MNVLIACEESQTVCKAFRELGHRAYSCDIQECSGGYPEWHICDDVLKYINGNTVFPLQDGTKRAVKGSWDLIIAHPPCTYLSFAGNKFFNAEIYGNMALEREVKRTEAAVFFMKIINANCEKIAVENPLGYMSRYYRKPDQIIHPYFFANGIDDRENYQLKRTCLWLKGLKPLEIVSDLPKPQPVKIRENGKRVYWCESMKHDKDRAKNRSKTFLAIAKAMADQWGGKVAKTESDFINIF
uniref:Cytosine specific methyltransferase n=1 Tax=virus sp. ctxZT69 TaxID=2826818 RepID=A0A8S5R7P5_9VIRU|nr:MAG TPA: Cytosine specific methyltransferase [virus sp. ctxZT69]